MSQKSKSFGVVTIVSMSKAERLEQIEQIRLLLSAFGSDDEAVEADPASPAAPGRSSSSSSSTTNISPIGGRKSNRLSISPIAAKSTRQQLIDRRLQFLKRVHGSIPVFDDGKPDPGCQYEVLQHRQAVDPVPYGEDNKNLQVGVNAVHSLWVVGIRRRAFLVALF